MYRFVLPFNFLKNIGLYSILLVFLIPTASKAAREIVKLEVIKSSIRVYQKPNFDSPVIYQLQRKKKVYGTRRLLEGQNGLGLFHKVRLRKGVYGYVLDTDVKIQGSVKASKKKRDKKTVKSKPRTKKSTLLSNQAEKKKKKAKDNSEAPQPKNGFQITNPLAKSSADHVPFFFRSYAGINLGTLSYAEKIVDGTQSSSEWMIGAKLTGPNWIFNRFMVDINVNFHWGAPKFFEKFSTEASGFILQADLTFPFQLKPLKNGSLYGGVGPLVSAAFFDFNYLGQQESSKNVRMGGLVMLGLGYDFGGFALRFEPKYYFENTSYFAFLAGIQKRL